MLDPDRLTFLQWFWLVFVICLIVFFICRWIDFSFSYGGR